MIKSSGFDHYKPAKEGSRQLLPPLFWLVFLFVGLAFGQLDLARSGRLQPQTYAPLLVLMACSGATVLLLRRRFGPSLSADPLLLPLTFFLSGFGLVLIARLAPAFIIRQTFWLALATVLFLLVNLVPHDLNWLRRFKYTWLIGGLLLLASTLLMGVNPSGFGARLWLQFGTIYFQPSELLKLLLVIFLAGYLADRRHHLIEARAYIGRLPIPHPAYLGPMLLMWGFSMVLLIWQRDLGAALLFFGTFLGMLYAATGQTRYVWAGVLLLAAAGAIGYSLFDVVRLRVDGFLDPWADASGRSFQIVQSLLAFASGGVFGEGLGQGLPTAIPVVHTDFVYAAIGEEYGMLGALGVLLCFALLVQRAFYIAIEARNSFEQLLAVGIGTLLALQTIVITGGTVKLLPLTGVTLPLVSYGGSSLLVSYVMVGLLYFISNKRRPRASVAPEPAGRDPAPSRHPIYYLSLARALFTGFLIVAGGLILWQVVLSSFLVSREDNPRPIIAEQRTDRGRLLTRGGVPIAETVIDENGLAERRYPYPSLSSVTGYYSIRYGAGGTEAAFDPILRGTANLSQEEAFRKDLLHQPLVGQDVTLTIDLPAQVAADVALGQQEGAVVVLDIESGAVLVMSSHPTYDPNTLDETWESLRLDERAPLLNRATQGLFPVGDLASLIGLIGLYEAGATVPAGPLALPAGRLAGPLGPTGYRATARQLGLDRPLPGLPSQPGLLPEFPPEGKGTVRDLAVTPLHMARLMAGLENEGQFPTPVLSLRTPGEPSQAIRPATARAVRAVLPQLDEQIVGFAGTATPQETGQASLSWFVGLAPATARPQAQSAPSAALGDEGLIFDPSQIPATEPTPADLPPEPDADRAKYAVVTVVVSDQPVAETALRIAKAAINALSSN